MKVDANSETLTNFEIAHRQLERSITLFLDEQDYVSALTLAGAADEILGKLLRAAGNTSSLDDITAGALRALGFAGDILKSQEANKARKEIVQISNYFRNRCKHFDEDDEVTFSVGVKAAEMIERAIWNYRTLTARETGAMGRFRELVISDE